MNARAALRLSGFGLAVILSTACSRSNNLLLGRVEATVDGHRVVVTDCYRVCVSAPSREEGVGGEAAYRFKPCRDADALIRRAELFVNGKGYGLLHPGDGVLVDHGVVSISRQRP